MKFNRFKIKPHLLILGIIIVLISIVPITFEEQFTGVNFWYYGNGANLIFSCNNGSTYTKVTTNNTAVACLNSQTSQNLTHKEP